MQDKNPNQHPLVERGWADMASRLDREMPVTRKRRRAGFLFLMLGLLLLLPGAIYLANNQGETPSEEHRKDLPVATADSSTDLQQNEESSGASEPLQQNEQSIESASSSPQLMKDQVQEDPFAASPEGMHRSNSPGNALPSAESASRNPAGVQTPVHTLVEDIPVLILEQPHQLKHDAIIPIENAGLRAFLLQERELHLPVRETELKPLRKSRWHLITSAGVHTTGDALVKGYDLGLGIGFEAGRKWGLQMLVAYGHYEEGGIVGGLNARDQSELQSTGPDGWSSTYEDVQADMIYNNTLSYEVLRGLSDAYDYLHLPVFVTYDVSPRWTLQAGPRVSKLINARAQFGINDQGGSAILDPNGSGNKGYLYQYDLVQKLEFGAMAGLAFRLNRNLTIEGNYIRSLTPILNKSGVQGRSDYLHAFRLGMSYQIL